MIVYHDIDSISDAAKIVSVGSYDGVHLGHRFLIDTLNKEADKREIEPFILTFNPHPKVFFGGTSKYLSSMEEQLILMEEAGARNVLVLPFDSKFSRTPYQDFVKDTLRDKLNVSAYVMGIDHTFGHNREGNAIAIEKTGIESVPVELLGTISSTEIRSLVEKGDIEGANRLLGGNGYLISSPLKDDKKLLPPPLRLYEATVDGVKTMVDINNLPSGVIRLIR